jgi:hypothetical protein
MATCGGPTRARRKASSGGLPCPRPVWRNALPPLGLGVVVGMCLVGLLTGCAPTMKFGSPPQIDRLAGLTVGVSTTSDVTRALGEPRGEGMARLTPAHPPRKILFYEYVESEGSSARFKMLLVFMLDDRYDGHLWFSASQLLGRSE